MSEEFKVFRHVYVYIWYQNYVITVPADGLAPNGARPSAGIVLTAENISHVFFYFYSFFLFFFITSITCMIRLI